MVFFYSVGIYNNLHQLKEPVLSANATLNSSIQRKKELSKDLVQIAENLVSHERDVHGGVVAAMVYASEKIAESKNPSIILTNLAAQFPNLKSNVAFETAQRALLVIENKIDEGLTKRNELADIYNMKRKGFPAILIASIFGFPELTYRDDAQSIALEAGQNSSNMGNKSAGSNPPHRNMLVVIGVIIVIAVGFYILNTLNTIGDFFDDTPSAGTYEVTRTEFKGIPNCKKIILQDDVWSVFYWPDGGRVYSPNVTNFIFKKDDAGNRVSILSKKGKQEIIVTILHENEVWKSDTCS